MTYLVIMLEGREVCRIPIEKESMAGSCSKKNAIASYNDGDCSFPGPSKTLSPERVVQEKKSWLNYESIEKEVPKLKHKKSSVQKRQSNKAKITIDREKVEWLKASRDYSFLSSDNDKFHGSGIKRNPWMVKNVSKSCDSLMPKKKYEVPRSGAVTPKPQVLSSKPRSKESRFKNSGRSNLLGLVRRRKQVIYEDEDDDDDQAIDIIRTVRYDSKKLTDDADDINVGATYSDTHKKDTRRAPRLLRKKIVEQEKRETKKRKMYRVS